MVLERLGRLDEAIELLRQLCVLTQDRPAPLSLLGHALAASDRRYEAEEVLQRLIAHPNAPDLDLARVYCGLRDTKQTLKRLEAAIDARDVHLLTVPTDRRFDWLRSNPAFAKLMRRMGLPASLRR